MEVNIVAWIAIASIGVTVSIFISQLIFKSGEQSARIKVLEDWRVSTRLDLHEVSDRMERIANEMIALKTMIDERTEKRISFKEHKI